MIKKKLDLLQQRIREIDSISPISVLDDFISSVNLDGISADSDNEPWIKSFEQDITHVMDTYKNQGASSQLLEYHLFWFLYRNVRKSAIYSYAQELDLDPTLFKDQMRFLFKGK